MPDLVYINGRVTAPREAMVPALDRGFLYGDALFETMRAYDARVFQLEAHLGRLEASAKELNIVLPDDLGGMAALVHDLVRQADLGDAYVRVAVSRGVGTHGLDLSAEEPTLMIWVRALLPPPAELYARGARLHVASARASSTSPLPRHKTANYLFYLLARQQARDAGADEALLLNERDEVTEGAASNLFIVRDGAVLTPPVGCGLLPGITRAVVMDLCSAAGIPCREETLRLADLAAASEAFLTNSISELLPACFVNGRPIGPGRPGPLALDLARRYRALARAK